MNKNTGIQIKWLSNLSSNPPCPGNKFPKSFISNNLLVLLAIKSPITLIMEQKTSAIKVRMYPNEINMGFISKN